MNVERIKMMADDYARRASEMRAAAAEMRAQKRMNYYRSACDTARKYEREAAELRARLNEVST